MKGFVILFLFLVLINFIYAECSENQIDINSASLEKLDELYGIGPAKAQAIIDARPFSTIDDLVKAYGIGDATLEKIKSQGIACVEDEEEIVNEDNEKELIDEDNEEEVSSVKKTDEEDKKSSNNIQERLQEEPQEKRPVQEIKTIKLEPIQTKDIKSENIFQDIINKKNIARIILTIFCIAIIGLLLIKLTKNKKYNKNDFG